MNDPYERDKLPEPTPRPRIDLWRPVRQLTWLWLLKFEKYDPEHPRSEAHFFGWFFLHAVAGFAFAAVAFILLGSRTYPISLLVGGLVFPSVALVLRAWIRSAMRLDDDASYTYWRDRFRL